MTAAYGMSNPGRLYMGTVIDGIAVQCSRQVRRERAYGLWHSPASPGHERHCPVLESIVSCRQGQDQRQDLVPKVKDTLMILRPIHDSS